MYNVMMGYLFMTLLFIVFGAILAPTGWGVIAMNVAFNYVEGKILAAAERHNGCSGAG